MRRRRGPTAAASMPHGKIYNPAKFCEVTGARRAPRHDPDHILASALECARHKTGLGYRLWGEFIRDFPGVRGGTIYLSNKPYIIDIPRVWHEESKAVDALGSVRQVSR